MKKKDEYDDFIFSQDDFLDEEDLEKSLEEEDFDDSDFEEDDFTDDMEFMDADDLGDFDFPDEGDEEVIEIEEGYSDDEYYDEAREVGKKKMKKRIIWAIVAIIAAFLIWLVGTNSGRSFALGFVARFIHSNVGTEENPADDITFIPVEIPEEQQPQSNVIDDGHGHTIDITDSEMEYIVPRSEDYVTTFLLFGLEQIDGAANTDAIMLVSVNTKDNTIKLTSILRDTYAMIPGWYCDKINSAYAKGAHGASTGAEARKNGANKLITTIEQTFDVDISGYACVNFASFEKIIDRLGGIDIELGEEESHYLNNTNYISEEYNRTTVPGWNHFNGNQAMGYVRVRKCVTLGGANNDYGRTVRQRRVISAIISKYKSSGIFDLFSITKDCLAYINTDLTEEQIQDTLSNVINNGIFKVESLRIPIEDTYHDVGKKGIDNGHNKITYALVIDDSEGIRKALHKFLFLDKDEEEEANE